jgi:hypothetical protein
MNVQRRPWRAIATESKPALLLILVMTVVAGGVGATMLGILYHAAFEEERQRLLETVRCTTSVLEASAAFFGATEEYGVPGGTEAAVLALIRDAHARYERFGAGADMALTKRRGDDIVFLLEHTREGHTTPPRFPSSRAWQNPRAVPFAGNPAPSLASTIVVRRCWRPMPRLQRLVLVWSQKLICRRFAPPSCGPEG